MNGVQPDTAWWRRGGERLLVLTCAFPQQETSCCRKVPDYKASSRVLCLADNPFLKRARALEHHSCQVVGPCHRGNRKEAILRVGSVPLLEEPQPYGGSESRQNMCRAVDDIVLVLEVRTTDIQIIETNFFIYRYSERTNTLWHFSNLQCRRFSF